MAGASFTEKEVAFTTFCERNQIPYRTKGKHTRAGWVQIDCPYCGPNSQKYHMGFCISRPLFNCWKCGKKPLGKTLLMITRYDQQEIGKIIQKFPRNFKMEKHEITGVYTIPKGVRPMKRMHRDYLRSRGFQPKAVESTWGVQGIGIVDSPLAYRLFFPIEADGFQCSWTTRTISDNPDIVRYLSADPSHERISHKKLVYGRDYCGNKIIVVEGPFDVIRIGPGAGGTFGTRPTSAQIMTIANHPVRYVCYDHGADRYSQALVEALGAFPGETFELKLDAKDPDSMSKKELRQVRRLLE